MDYVLRITIFNKGGGLILFIFFCAINGMLYANATKKLVILQRTVVTTRRALVRCPARTVTMRKRCIGAAPDRCHHRPSGGILPVRLAIHAAAEVLIIMALTAIGLAANLRKMASTGLRPILLGLGVWIAVAVRSLLVQLMIGQL